MEGVEDVGTDALQLLVLGGIPYAVSLFGLSLLLFLEGRKRIPMTVGLVGFVIAYSLIGPLYELLGPDPPLTKQMFHLVGAIGVGVIAVSVAEMAMRFMAAGLVYIVITNLIENARRFDVDLEGDAFLSGVLTLLAFFLSFSFRRLVPALMAGLIGTLGMMLSVYVVMGWPVERLNGVDAFDAYFALIGMLISARLQWKHIKEERAKEDRPEEEKAYVFD